MLDLLSGTDSSLVGEALITPGAATASVKPIEEPVVVKNNTVLVEQKSAEAAKALDGAMLANFLTASSVWEEVRSAMKKVF